MFPCLHLHKLELATSLLEKAKSKGVSLLLPSDVVIADKFDAYANSKYMLKGVVFVKLPVVPANSIPDGWMGLDIGPDSIKSFSESLDTTQTVNGPMGVFEFEKLAVGTEVTLHLRMELTVLPLLFDLIYKEAIKNKDEDNRCSEQISSWGSISFCLSDEVSF
ncbi:hypothetical protein L2E82_46170 [Cichorium intybus]|uniref:Uncharacterized protein n=1 Tax=Cichorium intybus TaxID=13427 RepID=A0ACB8YTF6_CICIN|nr:hypothetical protein L2E82_46170 [Cichorium intybus]